MGGPFLNGQTDNKNRVDPQAERCSGCLGLVEIELAKVSIH